MKPIRLLAAALAATAGLAFSMPAGAAPAAASNGFLAAAPQGNVIKVGYWDRDANRWVDTDRHRSRDGDRRQRADRRDDRWDRRADRRGDRWDRRADRRDDRWDRRADRRDNRWDRRADRRDDRWDRRDRRWDRGNHYGWDRGRHYGWRDDGHKNYKYKHKHKHWRADRHPRYRYWAGRRLPRQYVVIERYDDYYLPPPRRGYYYARVDNDVFLVASATKLIVDAFVLLNAASNY